MGVKNIVFIGSMGTGGRRKNGRFTYQAFLTERFYVGFTVLLALIKQHLSGARKGGLTRACAEGRMHLLTRLAYAATPQKH